jgi:hypothetical protein
MTTGRMISTATDSPSADISLERAERDSSKYRCRRYLVWSRYEIIWVFPKNVIRL